MREGLLQNEYLKEEDYQDNRGKVPHGPGDQSKQREDGGEHLYVADPASGVAFD
jgi:hypothetical protein